MLLWDLLGKFPGTDYESFNYEWVIGKLKELKDSVAAALASEESAAESASQASGAAGLAMLYRNAAKDFKDEAQGFANDAQDSAESISGVVDQVNTNTSRISNLIATAGDGTIPSELTDIRVAWDGTTYTTAGDAVRTQAENAELHIENMENVLALGVAHFKVTPGTPHQSTKILDVEAMTGEPFHVKVAYNVNDTAQVSITFYYDDNTSEGVGWQTVNTVKAYTPSKNIVGIGVYTNGTLPDGIIKVAAYGYDSAANAPTRLDEMDSDMALVNEKIGDVITAGLENIPGTLTTGDYINTNGAIVSGAGGQYTNLIARVTPGQTYYIKGSSNFANPVYAFFDSNMTLVTIGETAAAGSAVTSIETHTVAPNGSYYVSVEGYGSGQAPRVDLFTGWVLKGVTKKWVGKTWACMGDSLTDDNQYTTKHYFDFVADATGISPINMGDSGTGYARGHDTNRAFYQRISNIDPSVNVVTIFGSLNDLGAGIPLGTYTDTGTDTVAGCINQTITNLQSVIPAVRLGIVAPTPWMNTQPTPNSAADNYVNMLQVICEHRSIPFLDLYRCSNLRPWDADFRTLAYSNDGGAGTHPNELGHQIIAPKFADFLQMLML